MKTILRRFDLILVLVLFLLAVPAEYREVFSLLENQTVSLRHGLRSMVRGPQGFASDKLVLVPVDEFFYDEYGKFPITREDIARIIDNLKALNAEVICLDLFMGLPSAYGQDGELLRALMQSRSVLASEGIFDGDGNFEYLAYPIPVFGQAARSGYVNLISPSSAQTYLSRLRLYPEITRLKDGWPISVQVLSMYLNKAPLFDGERLAIGDLSMGVDQFNDIYIDFSAIPDGYTFLHESAGISAYEFLDIDDLDPLERRELREWVDGKIVFIGETLPASNDWFDTPVGMIYGVEIIAETVNTLMKQAPLRPAPFGVEILAILAYMGALVLITSIFRGPGAQTSAYFGLNFIYISACTAAYVYAGSVLSMSPCLTLGLVGFFILSLSSYMRDRRLHIAERDAAQARLRKAHDELEIRVAERTGELSRANEKLVAEIEERLRAERELQKAKKEADDANRAKSDFVSNMSHEIRTPMNAIIGFSDIALTRAMSEEVRAFLSKINTSSHYLLGIINDILDFAKIEAGKLELDISRFDLGEVVSGVGDLLGNMAAQKNLEYAVHIRPGTPQSLEGDALRLSQVLTNLLSNAIKFTSQGHVMLEVSAKETGPDRATLLFTVSDTGVGIDNESAGKLFESFTQADSTTTRRFGGSGLGLSICKSLVDKMGGRIRAQGEMGRGSTFSFTADFSIPEAESLRDASPGPETGAKGDRITGARVLLVEDNAFNQEVAVEMLRQGGVEADIAGNGIQALKMARPGRYQAILMDIRMPGMDGYEVTKRLRDDPDLAGLPVIAMTAHAVQEEKERCLNAGMDDFITKPIDRKLLFATLARWIPYTGGIGTAESSAPEEPAVRLPDTMPGLDCILGLQGVGGSVSFFLKVLGQFRDNYRDTCENLKLAVRDRDTELMKRTAHTLKGAAGQVGAKALRRAAIRFEEALKQERTDALADLSQELAAEFQTVFRSIDDLEKQFGGQKPKIGRSGTAGPLDDNRRRTHIRNLREKLEKGEFSAVECMQTFKNEAYTEEHGDMFTTLDKHVNNLDFNRACETLDELAHALTHQ